ncbi:ATP-binding cassette domain-containing protein [Gordonia sp. zg691]|uniref:ATP-binding cassette domain-containing protein n=1 Tax=Gordonia jinghuaiqii TaxID=2758710 RepID=A0A7D7LVP1_9ACTN|nr:ATP-binding cassette domain-containing protein [Gordonia jinghuaiqii]MBD0862483.1 ATP-binding cassette domain-containing protein [Gordonia jinghuaiqii]MCR5976584.1 ATP-binding cassette domain-containing protein [Gordonia jinghuaiqii]QMS99773.1 ATP-binding cassette domain-containing protein [Gordonia jinghuaiqii]
MSVLECRNLDAGYARGKPCVHGLDLTIAAGEVVALLGPNGAGKTTLLTTLAGLLPRLSGDVIVDGHPIRAGDARAAVRAGLVLVPDDRALFRRLSTTNNLRLASRLRGKPRDEALDRVLTLFPALTARLGVAAGELSGGEQQMLAIARALLQQPKVLLIDELSMGLAPIVVESILPVLRDVADTDRTAVVLVEQHVRLALEVADRALVLVHGELALEDSAAALGADIGRIEEAYLGTARA